MIFFRLLTFFQSLFRKMLCDFTRNVFVQLYYFIQLYESYYASYSKPIRLSCTKSIEQKVVIKIEKWTRKLRFLNIHNQHWNRLSYFLSEWHYHSQSNNNYDYLICTLQNFNFITMTWQDLYLFGFNSIFQFNY